MFVDFRERGREGERERERNIDETLRETLICFPSYAPRNGDWNRNLGMCPDCGSNPEPFGLYDDTPSNWTTSAGPLFAYLAASTINPT